MLLSLMPLIISLAALAIVLIIIFRPIMKSEEMIDTILNTDLDPPRLIREASAAVQKHRRRGVRTAYRVVLANGYLTNGEYDEAITLLQDELKNKFLLGHQKAVIHLLLGDAYFDKGEFEDAEHYFETAKRNWAIKMLGLPERIDAVLNIHRGNLPQALEYFSKSMQKKQNDNIHIMFDHYNLAIIYEKMGDTQNHRKHLEYIAVNGNTLHIARLARKKIIF